MEILNNDEALRDWKDLCTEAVVDTWNKERKELRRYAMLFYALKEEFRNIEEYFSRNLDQFHKKADLLKSPTQPHLESQLNRSPKLNKHRNLLCLKNTNTLKDAKVSNERHLLGMEPINAELFNMNKVMSVLSPKSKEDNLLKTPGNEDTDLVESSFVLFDTPEISLDKKFKWMSKDSKTKKKKNKGNQNSTLTQWFESYSSSHASKKDNQGEKENVPNQTSNKDAEDVVHRVEDDSEEEDENIFKIKLPKVHDYFQGYDELPQPKSKSPEHAHKGGPVRRKADRRNLRGWSCDECEQYYKGLDLSPDSLQKKMDSCSKHKQKYQFYAPTPKGFWDVTIPTTQDSETAKRSPGDETTFFAFE